jgi:4-hydroxybenzoate polyprenyltransferase
MTRRIASLLLYVVTLLALSYLLFLADVERIVLVCACFAVGVFFSMAQDEIERKREHTTKSEAVALYLETGQVPMCPINEGIPQSKCRSCIEDEILRSKHL